MASNLLTRLQSGDFVVTAEITPPVSTDPAEFISRALPLKGLATAVNVTDGAGAKVHLSSLAAAHFLVQNGIEPIFQMTCRDRNRLALQGDLLGAVSLGIRNVLCLAGDDPKLGDQPEAKAVFDLDSRGLLAMAHRMRTEQRLPSGTEVKGGVRLVLGAADMPIDPPPHWEPKALRAKLEAGADFVQTQFCMDVAVARRYARRLLDHGIAQRLPLITDAQIGRLEGARDAKAEGNRICIEVLQQLAEIPGVAGAHVMAPQNFTEIPIVIAESGVTGKKRKT